MKTNCGHAVREAQKDLLSLDSRGLNASELLEWLDSCFPDGQCSEEYVDTYHLQIEAARTACREAVERGAVLSRMATEARSKAAGLVSYAEERERQAAKALLIKLADKRFTFKGAT